MSQYAGSEPVRFLSEFQLHRRVHAIIGILDPTEHPLTTGGLGAGLASFHESLKDLPHTFATKVFGFGPSARQMEEARAIKEAEGLVLIPTTGDVKLYLDAIVADFASDVLREFSNMAAQLESRTSIPTPQEPHSKQSHNFLNQKTNPLSNLFHPRPLPPNSQAPNQPSGHRPLSLPPQSRSPIGSWGSTASLQPHLDPSNGRPLSLASPVASPSPPPGAAGLVDQRARRKVAGREKKLMADMWLLAGRIEQAIAAYHEAITLTKAWSDQVWQASALEGLCVALVVQAYASPARAPNAPPIPPPKDSSAAHLVAPPDPNTFLGSIPDRLTQASQFYAKLLPPTHPHDDYSAAADPDRTHPILYVECCLRAAWFLVAVSEVKGDIRQAIKLLVPVLEPVLEPPPPPSERQRAVRLASLSPSNAVPRATIAGWASEAYTSLLATVALPVRMRLTGEIASVYGRIGYRRKEAMLLRELAGLCAQGVAGRGVEVFSVEEQADGSTSTTIIEEDENGAPAMPAKQSASAPPKLPRRVPPSLLAAAGERGGSIVRTTSDATGNDSIIRLAERVCDAFGITVVPRLIPEPAGGNKRRSMMQGRALALQEDERRRFGWARLQVGLLKDAVAIAEALPDYQAAIRFTVTALRCLSDSMPPSEQYELSQNIPRVFSAATRRGAAFQLEYWGPTQLVMSLQVAPLSTNRVPFEHAYDDDVDPNNKPTATSAALATRNPFIYSPQGGRVKTAKVKPTLVQNDVSEFYVTLQNPFLFELEIQAIQLSTSGVPFDCAPIATVVPAGSFHTIRLAGTPKAPGLLVVRGVHIRLAGCAEREFMLPVWNDEEEAKRRKAAMLDTEAERVKASGLDAFAAASGARAGAGGEGGGAKFVECTVVPELPLLWIRSTSLTHGAIVLYDGEVSKIRIQLENTSSCAVDFVKLTFSDSHTAASQAFIAENDLSPAEAYEVEVESQHRPVFSWEPTSQSIILPGQTTILEVDVLGKVGCTSGTILLSYGFTSREVVKETKVFHTRQLFVDVSFSVHHALVVHSLEVLRLRALPEEAARSGHGRTASVVQLGRRGAALDKRLEDRLREVEEGEQVLVVVDVTNEYGKPFEAKFERTQDDDYFQVRQRLEPSATVRMLIPVERIALSRDEVERPIPSLSERQFVVAKVQQSEREARRVRELFWYRDALLARIQASWNEVGSLRSGAINLRAIRLTEPMLALLRADDVEVSIHLAENGQADPNWPAFELKGRGQRLSYAARSNEFVDVVIRVDNNSDRMLDMSFALTVLPPASSDGTTLSSPAALAHLARYVVVEGVAPVVLGRLVGPGETREARVSVCLLAEGRYEIGCEGRDRRSARGEKGVWRVGEVVEVEVEG